MNRYLPFAKTEVGNLLFSCPSSVRRDCVSFCKGHSVQLGSFAISVCRLRRCNFSKNLHSRTVEAISGSFWSLDNSIDLSSSSGGLNVKLFDFLKPIAMLLSLLDIELKRSN